MKNVLLGLGIGGAVIAAGVAIKKINDSRKVETVYETKDDEGNVVCSVVNEETLTFKEAAKRKVASIVVWAGENPEKVEGIAKCASVIAATVTVASEVSDLYSSIKRNTNKQDEKMLQVLNDINKKLDNIAPQK